jgi:hypothetical protein
VRKLFCLCVQKLKQAVIKPDAAKYCTCTVKKKVSDFPIPSWDVTNQTLPRRGKFNYSRPGWVGLVTSRLGTGQLITFFTVCRFLLYLVISHLMKLTWKSWNRLSDPPSSCSGNTRQLASPAGKDLKSLILCIFLAFVTLAGKISAGKYLFKSWGKKEYTVYVFWSSTFRSQIWWFSKKIKLNVMKWKMKFFYMSNIALY